MPSDTTLVMNKGISTPFNCAQRKPPYSKTIQLHIKFYFFVVDLSEMHCNRSGIALIDGNIPWDMHRPIEDSCTIQLLNFHIADPHIINR